jgi:hypothetical protein
MNWHRDCGLALDTVAEGLPPQQLLAVTLRAVSAADRKPK